MSVLFEFDEIREALIEPSFFRKEIVGFPAVGVSCFSSVLFQEILQTLPHRRIAAVGLASQDIPVYEVLYHDHRFSMYLSPVGAPSCVGIFEELIALGLRKLVLFGTCGVLDGTIADCSVIIPTSAIRDEGTSYHYAPPSDEIPVNPVYIPDFIKLLDEHGLEYTIGKTWTTDAFYRETKNKLAARRASGCITVDMEAASMAAAAKFRNVDLFHFFYAADKLDDENYDMRSLADDVNLDAKIRIGSLAFTMAEHMRGQ